jgi:hypothetical protein
MGASVIILENLSFTLYDDDFQVSVKQVPPNLALRVQ